jgi:hypothetical protein
MPIQAPPSSVNHYLLSPFIDYPFKFSACGRTGTAFYNKCVLGGSGPLVWIPGSSVQLSMALDFAKWNISLPPLLGRAGLFALPRPGVFQFDY